MSPLWKECFFLFFVGRPGEWSIAVTKSIPPLPGAKNWAVFPSLPCNQVETNDCFLEECWCLFWPGWVRNTSVLSLSFHITYSTQKILIPWRKPGYKMEGIWSLTALKATRNTNIGLTID
jgi:hypothetical protein